MKKIIDTAIRTLEKGGIILYPTDTIWGIGCNALDKNAMAKIYEAKERDESKSLLWLIKEDWIRIANDEAQHILAESNRPTTVIVDKRLIEPQHGTTLYHNWQTILDDESIATIGLRIPHHDFCQHLLDEYRRPITSTSANISGQPSPSCYDELSSALKKRMNYCVPNRAEFESNETRGSRIVMLQDDGSIKTIRE